MKNKVIRIIKLISLAALVVLLCVVTVFASSNTAAVYADEATTYSDVLDDLQTDESFNVEDYPANGEDYSLEIIQIAESDDGELLIYVYQPYTGSDYDLTATSINISTTVGDNNLSYKNYGLTLLSSSGTLHKYVVDDFTVESATVRYYDISSIYRTYYTDIDGEKTGDNTTSEFAIAVAQRWAAGEVNGETYYDMQETKVVTIESYADFVRYWTGAPFNYFTVTNNYVDSHFIAFSCDYDIEELYSADISFYTQSYWYYLKQGLGTNSESYNYEEVDSTYYDNPLTIDCGDSVSYDSVGFLGVFSRTTFSWDRICTVDDFLDNLDETESVTYSSDFIDTLSNYQWVVRFYETEFTYTYSESDTGSTTSVYSTVVTDVTILRLKFLSEGATYNVGVVNNKVTGSVTPGATVTYVETFEEFWDMFVRIILIIVGVILLVLLLNFVTPILTILKYLFKAIVYVISLPFRLLKFIFKRDG